MNRLMIIVLGLFVLGTVLLVAGSLNFSAAMDAADAGEAVSGQDDWSAAPLVAAGLLLFVSGIIVLVIGNARRVIARS
jgi:hypothetical protein